MKNRKKDELKIGDFFKLKNCILKWIKSTDDFCDVIEIIFRKDISKSGLAMQLFRYFYGDYMKSHVDYYYVGDNTIVLREYISKYQDEDNLDLEKYIRIK